MNGPEEARSGTRQARLGNAPRTVDSQTLLQGQSILLIHHQGEVYRLQLTRQGKLILTK